MIDKIIIAIYLIILFGIIPTVLSLPAVIKLKQRQQITWLDFGLGIYGAITWGYFIAKEYHAHYLHGLGFMFTEPVAIILMTIILWYGRLLLPKKVNKWAISVISILLMIIIATAIYFFMPSLGSES